MIDLASQLISIYQAMQLVGLAPCLFVILFLSVMCSKNKQACIPLFYFISLFCSFVLPLTPLSSESSVAAILHGTLLVGQSLLVACCFMLILQFIHGRMPPLRYWLVFLVPILGGGFIIYASLIAEPEVCDIAIGCINEESSTRLYNLFSSALVMLLLVYYTMRYKFHEQNAAHKHHQYYLAITLMLLHLALLGIDLLLLGKKIVPLQADFSATIIKLSFIYLVLTSLFRVYYPALSPQVVVAPKHDEEADKALLARLLALLDNEHIYREMRLNRAGLAKRLEVGENFLSRVMNQYLSQSFNELINSRRIEEAKTRLLTEDTPIGVIAAEVGFNSTASFNRVFRATTGCSPSQYRQDQR